MTLLPRVEEMGTLAALCKPCGLSLQNLMKYKYLLYIFVFVFFVLFVCLFFFGVDCFLLLREKEKGKRKRKEKKRDKMYKSGYLLLACHCPFNNNVFSCLFFLFCSCHFLTCNFFVSVVVVSNKLSIKP